MTYDMMNNMEFLKMEIVGGRRQEANRGLIKWQEI